MLLMKGIIRWYQAIAVKKSNQMHGSEIAPPLGMYRLRIRCRDKCVIGNLYTGTTSLFIVSMPRLK